MVSPTGTLERRVVRLSGGGALSIIGTIVGLVVARKVFVAAHQPLSWAAAAIVAAVLIDPVADLVAAHIRRGVAVLLTFLAVGAIGVGTTYLVFDEVEAALNRLERVAPAAARAIENRDDRVGELAVDFTLEERVTASIQALDARVTGGGDVLRSTAGTAPTYLVCTILTVFLVTYGPRMFRAAVEQDPDEARGARIADVVGSAVARARTAVMLTVGEGIVLGLAVAGVASVLDLPAPAAVGFTAGVLSLLPYVGLTIGAIPMLLLALAFNSLTTALVLFAAVLAIQVADSLLVRPRIAARSVDIGLVVPWVVALVGYTVYGIGGAVYATVYAIFGLAVLDRLRQLNSS